MRRFRISTVLLLGTLTALLTGCSRNPMSPDLTSAQGGAQLMGSHTEDTPGAIDGGSVAVAQTSLQMNTEGRLTVGRFTLDLHKNSLKQPCTIVMRVASEDAMEVELEVVPASANNFKVAADLTVNMSDHPNTDYMNTTVFSLNGTAWEMVPDVAAHPNQQSFVAKLKTLTAARVGEVPPAAETEMAR